MLGPEATVAAFVIGQMLRQATELTQPVLGVSGSAATIALSAYRYEPAATPNHRMSSKSQLQHAVSTRAALTKLESIQYTGSCQEDTSRQGPNSDLDFNSTVLSS